MIEKEYDCIVIGGGQSALATAYFLRRTNFSYVLLDKNKEPGGSWQHYWESLTLFSPAKHSSLPGFPMPASKSKYPTKEEVIQYLTTYEERYKLPVFRGVEVLSVRKENGVFYLETTQGIFQSKVVVGATGIYEKPSIPAVPGREGFRGIQLHSTGYSSPDKFKDKNVLIVGEGNTGAQLLAELSAFSTCFWGVKNKPEFLPDEVDGAILFDQATAVYYSKQKNTEIDKSKLNLGNIVALPSIQKARSKGVYNNWHRIDSFSETGVNWKDGSHQEIDAIIWCTGFQYATDYLSELTETDDNGKIKTDGTQLNAVEGAWLVGFGNWTGFASATLIGVGRTARKTVNEIKNYFSSEESS